MEEIPATAALLTADRELIEAFGGTAATAKVCEVSSQAVSQWKADGIPKPRRMFLRLLLEHRRMAAASEVSADAS